MSIACQVLNFTWQRANKHTNVPINMPTCHTACQYFRLVCQRAKRHANFSNWFVNLPTFLLRNDKGNFYTLLYKKFYIILDVIVIHIVCICIVHKNYIMLHLYTSCHIKEQYVELFLFYHFFPFCFLVRNENIKKPGFYTLQVKSNFSNFPLLKQLNKIKTTCKYCDLLEL